MRVYKIDTSTESFHLSDLKEIAFLLTKIEAPITISPIEMTPFEFEIIDEQENKRINNESSKTDTQQSV